MKIHMLAFMRLTKKAYAILVFLALVLAVLLVRFELLFLLGSWSHVKNAMNGLHLQESGKITYYEINHCAPKEPCTCVMLIHGLGDSPLTWKNILLAKESKFSKKVDLFAPDVLSFSDHETPTADYNVQKMSSLLAKNFLDKCPSWVLVGNSFGGWMAPLIALQDTRVRGLLLVDPAGLQSDYSKIVDFFVHPNKDNLKQFNLLAHGKKAVSSLPDFAYEQFAEKLQKLPLKEELQAITKEDYLDDKLPKLKIPVTYLWGEDDGIIPPALGKQFQAKTPGSKLVTVPNCAHLPQKDCADSVFETLNPLL